VNAAIVVALAVVGIVLLPIWRATDPAIGAPTGVLTDAPSGITAALRTTARPGDRMFNPQPWGSWFELALPDIPVAIDSRIELFPVGTWDDYETVASGRDDWQSVLERWGVTLVVVPAADDGLSSRLAGAGWQEGYAGGDGWVYLAPGR
jgi:hypothetical protein